MEIYRTVAIQNSEPVKKQAFSGQTPGSLKMVPKRTAAFLLLNRIQNFLRVDICNK